MATLAAIGISLAGSVGVFTATMVAFGQAIRNQNTFVAARCTARPPTVIHNPSPYRHPSQDRGNPTLGWIPWVMRMTYDTMLRGVPGTGTRDGGLSGSLLKVNLDGIVLLRFHHLGLRVCTLAMILYMVVLMPLFYTARCSDLDPSEEDEIRCQQKNLTDYQRLTLASIPILQPQKAENFWDRIRNWFVPVNDGDMARLYAVVFCAWIVTYYALRELQVEWGDVLAIRRVYYLEADHWEDRNEELQETLLRVEREKSIERRNSSQNTSATSSSDNGDSYLTERQPWIPHPEQRDTVPNIELYSVLVGGLPGLPTEVIAGEDAEAVFSRKQSIDWQLAVTSAFFDHCVPNQPGFSSSIAAVTILPSAQHLTEAWNQWYRVAGRLRRLRFIRKEIARRTKKLRTPIGESKELKVERHTIDEGNGNKEDDIFDDEYQDNNGLPKTIANGVYTETAEKREYYKEVLGSVDDTEVENKILSSLNFGPEQTATYSREFALGAANLAPFGWNEGRILNSSLHQLMLMEREASEQVKEANAALKEAQEVFAEEDDSEMFDSQKIDRSEKWEDQRNSFHALEEVQEEEEEEEEDIEKGMLSGSSTPSQKRTTGSTMKSGGYSSANDSDSDDPGFITSGVSVESEKSGMCYNVDLKLDESSPRKPSSGRRKVRQSSSSMSMSEFSQASSDKKEAKLGDILNESARSRYTSSSNNSVDGSVQRARPRRQKTRITKDVLPSNLGLEAGLFMEQKRNAKTPPNRSKSTALKKAKSSLNGFEASARTSLNRQRTAPVRGIGRSGSSRNDGTRVGRLRPPNRSRSSDEIDIMSYSLDPEQSPKQFKKRLSTDSSNHEETPWRRSPNNGRRRLPPKRSHSSDDIEVTGSWDLRETTATKTSFSRMGPRKRQLSRSHTSDDTGTLKTMQMTLYHSSNTTTPTGPEAMRKPDRQRRPPKRSHSADDVDDMHEMQKTLRSLHNSKQGNGAHAIDAVSADVTEFLKKSAWSRSIESESSTSMSNGHTVLTAKRTDEEQSFKDGFESMLSSVDGKKNIPQLVTQADESGSVASSISKGSLYSRLSLPARGEIGGSASIDAAASNQNSKCILPATEVYGTLSKDASLISISESASASNFMHYPDQSQLMDVRQESAPETFSRKVPSRTNSGDSIWDKLQEAKERREKLRSRLASIKNGEGPCIERGHSSPPNYVSGTPSEPTKNLSAISEPSSTTNDDTQGMLDRLDTDNVEERKSSEPVISAITEPKNTVNVAPSMSRTDAELSRFSSTETSADASDVMPTRPHRQREYRGERGDHQAWSRAQTLREMVRKTTASPAPLGTVMQEANKQAEVHIDTLNDDDSTKDRDKRKDSLDMLENGDHPGIQSGHDVCVRDGDESSDSIPSMKSSDSSTSLSVSLKEEKLIENDVEDKFFSMNELAAVAAMHGERQGLTHYENPPLSPAQEQSLQIAYDFEEKCGLRHRDLYHDVESNKTTDEDTKKEDKWGRVLAIVQETSRDQKESRETKERMVSSGYWNPPSFAGFTLFVRRQIKSFWSKFQRGLKRHDLVDDLVRDSSYAVVTFTSRQAAVAARHCLADSRGNNRWKTVCDIPSPPLADAPVCNISSFRGCVRPVTLSISDKQKTIRRTFAMAALVCIYFFYTIPLTAVQNLVSPESLITILPDLQRLQERSEVVDNILSGFIPALIWTGFIAVCPPMFKIIANFGSNATSSVAAENSALQYFWWFMLISAFSGTSFATAIINGFSEGLNLGKEIQKVIQDTADTIPTEVSAVWLNWIIVRVFAVLPTQYLLQLNTFIFTCCGLTCCARTVRGGGAGGPVPYRIYVDSGVVMLCVFALGPASPLIAPAAFMYFLLCVPLLRWTMIFLYRPKFDIGGGRFPFIFDICVSAIITSQILLIAMMVLKAAIGPAVAAFCPMIPTLWFRYFVRKRYLRAFNDAALLQTSLLDGWDTNEATSQEKREDFRKFLVDCHKAAYVPVCIAGDQTLAITAEPAVVIPTEFDDDEETVYDDSDEDLNESHNSIQRSFRSDRSVNEDTLNYDKVESRFHHQHGAYTRRSAFLPMGLHAPEVQHFGSINVPVGGQQVGAMMRRTSFGPAGVRRVSSLNTPNSIQRRPSIKRRSSMRSTQDEYSITSVPTPASKSPTRYKSPRRRMKTRLSTPQRISDSVTPGDFPMTPLL